MARKCEEVFASHMSHKGLISKIYKEPVQLSNNNNKKRIIQLKMGKVLEQTFFERRCTSGQQTHEKVLNITNIKEMHIKGTMKCYLTLVRMAIIKKTRDNKCRQECRAKGNLIDENVTTTITEDYVMVPQKTENKSTV